MADTYTLADLMEEQRTLGGRPALPDVRPREMRTPPLGQGNLVDRALSSFGQPSLDALREGYAGNRTPQEIARTFLETGPVGPFGAVRTPNPIRAYHGSPHDFDEFRMDRIGTGEGAQAYGHGLYFAEAEPVARNYRYVSHDASPPVYRTREEATAAAGPGDTVRQSPFSANAYYVDRANPGRMYEVNLHARPEQFLDWDRPISQQSDHVRRALHDNWIIHTESHANRPGEYAYWGAANPLQEYPSANARTAANSDVLQQAGIPGIRYLDQGSRGMAGWKSAPEPSGPNAGLYQAGITRNGTREFQYFPTEQEARAWAAEQNANATGTSNYVVFNPEIIEILRKYGIIAPPVGAAAASTLAGEPQP